MTMYYKLNKKHATTFPKEFFAHAPVVVIRVSSRSTRVYVVEDHKPDDDGMVMGCYDMTNDKEKFDVKSSERITKREFKAMTGKEE